MKQDIDLLIEVWTDIRDTLRRVDELMDKHMTHSYRWFALTERASEYANMYAGTGVFFAEDIIALAQDEADSALDLTEDMVQFNKEYGGLADRMSDCARLARALKR